LHRYSEDIAWTLQTLSPNVLELSSLWEAFEGKPLVDVDSSKFADYLPFEAEAFRTFQTESCERVKGSLWTTWVPKSAEIFRRHPPVCINGDTEAYYRSVASLQSIQLRGLVQHNLDAYVAFFDSHDPPDTHLACDPQAEKLSWSVPPAFVIRLREGPNGGYAFSPSFREVEDVVRGVLDQFVLAINGIPRVGAAAANPSRRGQHIPGVQLDEVEPLHKTFNPLKFNVCF
jgi:dynein heavy chain